MNRMGQTSPVDILTVEMMLEKMRQGVKTEFELRLRAMVFHVRILALDEMNQIRRFAISEATKMNGDAVDRNVEMQKATLRLASTLDKGSGPIISDKLMSLMTTDEMNDLYDQYVNIVDSVNPSLESIPQEQFRALVDALKKNQITWRDCSLKQLRAICTSYQALIQKLDFPTSPEASSSGGQPLGPHN